ncbi:MAG: adenosine-specific kinase [Bacteroidetes bacterium]|jgi:hypothetical protein|nr:adenosine-specific kinase [Bacteroidota bacterium]
MQFTTVRIEKPENINFILGQSHFIKTVEDIHEAVVSTAPQMKFGVAFCEASGPALIRWSGNEQTMIDLAIKNAQAIGCGHSFILFIDNGFPVNVLNTIKNVPEVCRIYCATANQTDVIVGMNEGGRGIVGVIDGSAPKGVETEKEIAERTSFLRKIGYKLG